jgi:hypothetical protein
MRLFAVATATPAATSVATTAAAAATSVATASPSSLNLSNVKTRLKDITYAAFQIQSRYTDKKENQIFLIYKEIQSGAVAKSYMSMTNGLLIYRAIFAHFLIY